MYKINLAQESTVSGKINANDLTVADCVVAHYKAIFHCCSILINYQQRGHVALRSPFGRK